MLTTTLYQPQFTQEQPSPHRKTAAARTVPSTGGCGKMSLAQTGRNRSRMVEGTISSIIHTEGYLVGQLRSACQVG
jgi:hypothetical protein